MTDVVNQRRAIALIMVLEKVSWLSAVRRYKQLSRADAAKRLNITAEALKRIEKKEQISAYLRMRIAEVYGCQEELLVCPPFIHGHTE